VFVVRKPGNRQHWESIVAIEKITLSGLAGVGKGTTTRLLAEQLGWQAVSAGDLYRQLAEKKKLSLAELETLATLDSSLDRDLDDYIRQFGATHRQFVCEGRLTWHFIPDAFKVKLDCDFDTRIQRIAAREQIPIDQARSQTLHRENAIRLRYRTYYQIDDFLADRNFDLVVDTTRPSPEQVASVILTHIS